MLADERVAGQLVAHRLADRARSPAVDHPHLGVAGERRVVDERAHGLTRLLCRAPAEIQLERRIGGGEDGNLHRGGLSCDPGGITVGAETVERDANPEASRSEHCCLVTRDLGDGAAHADGRRHDRVAHRERPGLGQRRVCGRECVARTCRSLGRRAEQPIALALGPACACGACRSAPLLRLAGSSDLATELFELVPCGDQLLLHLRDGALALGVRRQSDALDLAGELAPLRLDTVPLLGRQSLGRQSPCTRGGRITLSSLGLSEELGDP